MNKDAATMDNYYAMERYKKIKELLENENKLTVKDIATTLYVSPATVRRDLSAMQTLGMIRRIRGGALVKNNSKEASILLRKEENIAEKIRIGSIAAKYIPEFKSIFIDNSSTCLAFLRQFDFSYKTVVTNGLQCALELSRNDKCNLILLGGKIWSQTDSTDGPYSLQMLKDFHIDLMLSSCACIRKDGTYEVSSDTSLLKKTAYGITEKHILLIDKTKFIKDTIYHTKSLRDYDLIVTDAGEDILKDYRGLGNFVNN